MLHAMRSDVNARLPGPTVTCSRVAPVDSRFGRRVSDRDMSSKAGPTRSRSIPSRQRVPLLHIRSVLGRSVVARSRTVVDVRTGVDPDACVGTSTRCRHRSRHGGATRRWRGSRSGDRGGTCSPTSRSMPMSLRITLGHVLPARCGAVVPRAGAVIDL